MLLPIWLLVRDDVRASFSLLLIASKEIPSIALVVFWIAMGDLLHGRQAKRLFAPMMAGVTLGSIFGSFASAPIGRWLGIEGLLPVSVAVLAVGACAALPLRKLRPSLRAGSPGVRLQAASLEVEEEATGASARIAVLWRESALFRLLFATALCSGLLGPMLYFQFSYVANLATAGAHGEQKLLAFYAQFRGWINLATLATQLLVASSLYRAIGIPLSIALAPLVYLFGFLGLSVRLSLPAGVGAMSGTKLQDSAVYDPAIRVLYNLLPERIDTGRQRFMAERIMKLENITFEQAREKFANSIAARRLGRPEEFGDACAFLCSAQAGFISGQNLQLDGGSYPGLI
jgi:hypothetical protein